MKNVFSQAPNSPDCILAAMTNDCGMVLCRIGCPNGRWATQVYPSEELAEIAFYDSELYGLCHRGELVQLDIGVNEDGAPMVTAHHRLATNHSILADYSSHNKDYKSYILDLNGKLAMALRTQWSIGFEPFFKVFELVDIYSDGPMTRYNKKWMELTSLCDHALFLGRTFSKVVHLPADRGWRCGEKRHLLLYHCC
jgi:hypothetical protein